MAYVITLPIEAFSSLKTLNRVSHFPQTLVEIDQLRSTHTYAATHYSSSFCFYITNFFLDLVSKNYLYLLCVCVDETNSSPS